MPPAAQLARRIDRFGAAASFICALHCMALPFVLAMLPALGLGVLADHRFERVFVAFASVLALASLGFGFRHHRRLVALVLLVPGVVLLLAGIAFDGMGSLGHGVLVAVGGCLVALAHLANMRLAHGHWHHGACSHDLPVGGATR